MKILKIIIRFVGNFYWKIFGGVILSLLWLLIGVILIVTVIGYDCGVQCLKISRFVYKPFGKSVVFIAINPISSTFWIGTLGLVFGVVTLTNAIISIATLGGLIMIKQWYKIFELTFFPFSSVICKQIA